MAVLIIGELEGGDAALDARITQELGGPPLGALAAFAGPTATGGWRVVSAWESEEAFRTYEREQLMPILERIGRNRPTIQVSPLERSASHLQQPLRPHADTLRPAGQFQPQCRSSG